MRVEKSTYDDRSFVYVMAINHDICSENREYFDTTEDAVKFFKTFKTVSDCKNFIKDNTFPEVEKVEEVGFEVMSREEIIEKGEKQLRYVYDQMMKGNSTTVKKSWADGGINQLEMLSYLLDEKYERYAEWFDKFYEYA